MEALIKIIIAETALIFVLLFWLAWHISKIDNYKKPKDE